MNVSISQPDIINNMNQVFKGDLKSLMTFNTPATPHKGIVSNQETDTNISYDINKRYRNGIGYLLYLVKHSQPKLSNVLRELSKCMDKANMSHCKTILRAINYIIDTQYYFYQIKQEKINGPW